MDRDMDIQRVFEIADDSLQGVIGYHLYVSAIQKCARARINWVTVAVLMIIGTVLASQKE